MALWAGSECTMKIFFKVGDKINNGWKYECINKKKSHKDLILQWPVAGGIPYLRNMPLEDITARGFLPPGLTLFSGYFFFSGS